MCYRCNKLPPTGYRGQKYEVSCLGFGEDETVRHVCGWTNDPTGGAIVKMIEAHPVWNSPEVKTLVPWTESDVCWCQPFDGPIHPQCPMHGGKDV